MHEIARMVSELFMLVLSVISVPSDLKDFTVEGLRKSQSLDLKSVDGVVIHVRRSGSAVYLTPEKGGITYACHKD